MTGRRASLLLVPLLFLGACSGSDDEDRSDAREKDPKSSVDFDDCDVDVPAGVDMRCGTLEVLADRDDPDGGEIEPAFGIVRSDAPTWPTTPSSTCRAGRARARWSSCHRGSRSSTRRSPRTATSCGWTSGAPD